MALTSVAFECAVLMTLALISVSGTPVRPEETAAVSTLSASNVRQIQAMLKEALPLYRAATKSAHKEPGHGKLSIANLILIIGKILAPLVGAIVEPLLINIAKGITWAITYSLATGFDKPPSYQHFVPTLEHHGGGGDYDDGEEYESHKPIAYSLKELPGLALQLTSTVLSGVSDRSEQAEVMENAERKIASLLLRDGSAL